MTQPTAPTRPSPTQSSIRSPLPPRPRPIATGPLDDRKGWPTMGRAWLVDLISSIVLASMVAGIVIAAGAPPWAAIGFGLVYYLLRPYRAQTREAAASAAHWIAAQA